MLRNAMLWWVVALFVAGVGVAHANGLAVSRQPFGKLADGTGVYRYHMTNSHGMQVDVITYGATVQSIVVPNRDGELDDVALGFDSLQAYVDNNAYFGATIGRYGNRIDGGQFTLQGEQYQIPTNNGSNALHGGPTGFDERVWAAEAIRGSNWVGVEMTYFSPDGEMGFPGNLAVTVRYTLNNDNELRIHYSAVTDQATVLNLTNHTYFNLTGAGEGTVLDAVMMINADRFTPIDETLIPTGELRSVAGTPLDFTEPTPIGARIHADYRQLEYAEPKQGGYDFNWVLNHPGDLETLAVRVLDPETGRVVEMYTTEPGVQVYTGNFLDGSITGKDGESYGHWGAFTLEAQHFPDSPNQPDFPSTVLLPGEKYTQTTMYKFLPL